MGRVSHAFAIDEEVANVPEHSLRIEGTTFVTESVYVAVYRTKTVLITDKDKTTAANSLGRGDKDAVVTVRHRGEDSYDRHQTRTLKW